METNRTEKIIEAAKSVFAKDMSLARFREVVDASFDEAVREAAGTKESTGKKGCGHDVDCNCYRDKYYTEGFAAAREQAAGIANSSPDCSPGYIAECIRAMVPGEGK